MTYESTAVLAFTPRIHSDAIPQPRRGDNLSLEASVLLENVRKALETDLGAATKAAGHLANLLGRHLSETPRIIRRGGLAAWQMRKVKAHIECSLHAPILLEDLARLVSLSSSYFCRAFKESFGSSPHAYIIRMRMEKAKELMLATAEPLSQIAIACGLADQAHLTRRFREAVGTTPAAWRRSHLAARPAKPDAVESAKTAGRGERADTNTA